MVCTWRPCWEKLRGFKQMRSSVLLVDWKVQSEVGKLFCNSLASGGLLLNRVKYKVIVCGILNHKWRLCITLPHHTAQDHFKRRGRKMLRTRVWRGSKRNSVFCTRQGRCTLELRVPGVACTGSGQGRTLQNSSMEDQGLLSLHPNWEEPVHALVDGPTSWHVWVIQIGFAGLLKVLGGIKLE